MLILRNFKTKKLKIKLNSIKTDGKDTIFFFSLNSLFRTEKGVDIAKLN
jgi:hypothetical protein